ncbi:MAG: glycine--tRNA ligase subunit beta [Atribacterota bacterium]
MNKVILEIGTEEIPSIYIDKALTDLRSIARNELRKFYIEYSHIKTYGTPRRLIVYIENINSQQEDIFKKVKGPSKNISFDKDGNPRKPALKFAQANNIEVEKLIIEKTRKGEYLFAQKIVKGKKTETLLPEILLKVIVSLNFPKSMRWGDVSFRFIRPIKWLLALYNDKIIHFNLEKLNSDCNTFGHRLLSPKSESINSVDRYFKIMNNCFVIIDPDERKKIISNQIKEITKGISGRDYINQTLLDEVKNLVEYPRVLLGQFGKNYLELPSEVLKSVMIKHQKYFPAYSKEGYILPYFFVVINGNEDKYKDIIIRGNEKVLKARLEDARFFYQEDQKVTAKNIKPLDNNLEKLKNIVYQENLGSMFNKVERLIALVEAIGTKIQLINHQLEVIKRSAQLCKSDLVTEMVKEFPELQGIMGKEYAILQGEDRQVAESIFEHYLPRFSDDDLPKTISGKILSIADKIDNITSCFVNNNIPDGSQDPYALRRQALGIINTLIFNNMDFPLDEIINLNIELLLKENNILKNSINNNELAFKIKDFIFQRFRYLLIERGYNYDVIDAVLVKSPPTLIDALLRIKVIQNIYNYTKFNKIITAATRTFNLSKNARTNEINCTIFQEKEEDILYKNYLKISDKIEKAVLKQEYDKIFDYLELMTEPINSFFDSVLVMDKDEIIRNNRLALLKNITNMYYSVADLSKIALAKGESR